MLGADLALSAGRPTTANGIPPSGGGGASYSNGYALGFDGTDDFVDLGNSSDLAPSSITISAWIKVTGSVDTFNYIVSRAGSTYGSYHLRYKNDNKFNVHLGFASSQFKNDITSSSTYTLTDWHHVAFTYDQTNAKLYVDGVQEYSGAETRAIDYTPAGVGSNTRIGSTPMGYPSPSEGLIDEVAIFNSALSGSDITAIYNSGTPDDLSSYSPVGWWRMGDNDSGTGTTITDQGSGGNDGTLTNGPTFHDLSTAPDSIYVAGGGGGGYSNTYSLDFNGYNDYLATTYQYGSATQFTYSFWIKTTDTGSSHWVGNSATGALDTRCHFGTRYGNYYFLLGNSSNYYQVANAGSASAVTDGNWHHMVFQWDGTNTNGVKLYVDGNTTPVFTYTSNIASDASTAPLRWGHGWGTFYAYDDLMDEAALFESILSTSDIETLYNDGVPGDISSLNPVGWWRMGDDDGGTGTTITDQGSGGNDGTLTNGPIFSTDVPS